VQLHDHVDAARTDVLVASLPRKPLIIVNILNKPAQFSGIDESCPLPANLNEGKNLGQKSNRFLISRSSAVKDRVASLWMIDPIAFVVPPVGQQGDFGRNALRGLVASQAELALPRQFHVTEQVGLRLLVVFWHLQSAELRQSRQQHYRSIVRPLDANAGEQSGLRRGEWRFQPPLPNWGLLLDPASILSDRTGKAVGLPSFDFGVPRHNAVLGGPLQIPVAGAN
jgi:hypothetical protein